MTEDRGAVTTLESGANAIRKSIVVAVNQQRAFDVFTKEIDSWWPRSHTIGSSPLKEEIIEPKEGGRWYGIGEDGSESYAGYVLAWEPPDRVVLSWQITGEWQYDPSFVTEVEVLFIAEGPDSTRVNLEHRSLDRFGTKASEMRQMFESPGAWTGMLQMYANVAEGRPAE